MAMNTEATIIVAVTAAAGLHLAARLSRGERDPGNLRVIVGGFVLAAVLLLGAGFWPTGARGLAVAVLVTSIVMNGRQTATLLASLVD